MVPKEIYVLILAYCVTVSHASIESSNIPYDVDDKDLSERSNETTIYTSTLFTKNKTEICAEDVPCNTLKYPCVKCILDNHDCVYGRKYNVVCVALNPCEGENSFVKVAVCRYCYQTLHWEHTCIQNNLDCPITPTTPPTYYRTNCTVNADVVCLGRRQFLKRIKCDWTCGHKWSTALWLSITLGGFGVDRMYLGHWQEGLGKLFSFGGLGVWTLLDVVLIATGYLGPSDGSVYVPE